MREAFEATIEPDGTVRLREQIRIDAPCRALVVILDEADPVADLLRIGESALADWAREEEDAAWAHLQPVR